MPTHRLRARLIAALLAVAASASLLIVPPHTTGERVDLEALLPFLNQQAGVTAVITGPGFDNGAQDSRTAGLLLIGLAVLGGLPLLAPRSRRVLAFSATLMSLFVVVTILRNGLLFLPSAVVLCRAALRPARR